MKYCFQCLFFIFCFGIIRSQDIEWLKLNGPNGITLLDGIYLEKTHELMILTGSFQVYKSKDFGEHWKHIEMNFDSKHSYYNNATEVYSGYFQQERTFKFIYKMPNDSIYFLLDHGLYCFNQMNQLILIDSLCGQYNSYIGDDGYIFRWTYQEMFYSNDYAKTFKKYSNKIENGEEILFNDSTILYGLLNNERLFIKSSNNQNQEINLPNDEFKTYQFYKRNFYYSKKTNVKPRIFILDYGKLKYSEDNGSHWLSIEKEILYGSFLKLFEHNDHTLLMCDKFYFFKSNKDSIWKKFESKEINYKVFKAQYIPDRGWIIFSSNGISIFKTNSTEVILSIPKNEPLLSDLSIYSNGHISAKVDNSRQLSTNNGRSWKNIELNIKETFSYELKQRKSNFNTPYFYYFDYDTKHIKIYNCDFEIIQHFVLPDSAKLFVDVILTNDEIHKFNLLCLDRILYTSSLVKPWKQYEIAHFEIEYSTIFNDNNIFICYDGIVNYSDNYGETWKQFISDSNFFYYYILCYLDGYLYWTEYNQNLEGNRSNFFLYASPDFGKAKILVDSGYTSRHFTNYFSGRSKDLFIYNSDSIYLKAIQKGVITDQLAIMHNSFYHTPNRVTIGDNGYLYYTSPNCVLQRSKYRYKVNEKGKIIAYE